MSERQLQEAILEMAALLGWRCFHPRPARTSDGWRTAVEGAAAAGFPDLTLVRDGHLIFAELKAANGRLSAAQQGWIEELGRVSFGHGRVQVYEWRPQQWLDGSVERVLRETGRQQAAA